MNKIKLKGGHLSLPELNAIFTTIPQEFDVLDENDIVVWSSLNEHRIFLELKKILARLSSKFIPVTRKVELKLF